jgi:hypothetical protein
MKTLNVHDIIPKMMNDDHLPRRRRLPVKMTPIMWGLLIAFVLTTLITAYLTFLTVRNVFGAEIRR